MALLLRPGRAPPRAREGGRPRAAAAPAPAPAKSWESGASPAPAGWRPSSRPPPLWLNTLLIGAMRSVKEAGVYAASSRYLAMAAMAAVAIRQVLAPKLSELLARRSTDRAGAAYQATTAWMVALNWPIYLVPAHLRPGPAAGVRPRLRRRDMVLLVLSATMLVANACGPVDVVLLMGGRSSWNLVNTLVSLGANLGLNFVLTPRYGLAGARSPRRLRPAQQPAPLAQVWWFMGLHPFGAGTGVAAALSAVSFGVLGLGLRALAGPTVTGFVAYAVLGCLLYAALLWRFRDRLEWEALSHPAPAPPAPVLGQRDRQGDPGLMAGRWWWRGGGHLVRGGLARRRPGSGTGAPAPSPAPRGALGPTCWCW